MCQLLEICPSICVAVPQTMFYKLVLLVILASLQPGKLQEEQPTPEEGSDGMQSVHIAQSYIAQVPLHT